MRPYFRYILYIFPFPLRFVFFSVAFFRVELLMDKGACVISLIDPIHSDYPTIGGDPGFSGRLIECSATGTKTIFIIVI